MLLSLAACGGGNSGDGLGADTDAGMPINQTIQQDAALACDAPFDNAELLFTEIDRQWSCEITSAAGTEYSELYFGRDGTAVFNSNDTWYWNRKLPGNDIGLASPARPSKLIQNINSSNTLMSFSAMSEVGVSETYDCLLVTREINI